jgi:hypothetical protein
MVRFRPAAGFIPVRFVRPYQICDAVCVKNKSDCAAARKFPLPAKAVPKKEPAGGPAGSRTVSPIREAYTRIGMST